MNFIISSWVLFHSNILTKPQFFVGFIVFLGYVLLRKSFYEALAGAIKATVGYMILNVAVAGLVHSFQPILSGLNQRFRLNAVVIDPYFGQVAAQRAVESVGRSFALMMQVLLVAFIWNLILVFARRLTKVRTVFITGHIMVQQASTALWIVLFCFPRIQNVWTVVLVGLLLGSYWAVASNMTVNACQELTGGGGFALGHQQMFGVWLTDVLTTKFGRKTDKKLEDLQLPGVFSMFYDNIVATSILMTLFFCSLIGLLGQEFMHELDKGFVENQSFFFYIIEKSLAFTVYLQILQLGVRIFVAELVVSFQGISERLLPGAMPAIDCAAFFGFGHPNVVIMGFLFGVVGQFIAIIGLIVFKSPVFIITGFVPVFFDNATLAVFAHKKGGCKWAVCVPFVSGLIQVLGGAFAAFYFGLGKYGGWHGNFDWAIAWPVYGVVINVLRYSGIVLFIIAMLAIPQIQYYFGRYKKEKYFKVAEMYDSVVSAG